MRRRGGCSPILPRSFNMQNSRLRFFQKLLPPFLLAISLTAIYLMTLAPGLTWANGGGDGGDLIAAVATGGVPHPTGYPLYLLLARLFQFLPIGSLAWRTNLLSALASVLAAALIYRIVVRDLKTANPLPSWIAGLVAGLAFGLAPLVWSQAVITEVYALQALLVALLLYLYTGPEPASPPARKRLDRLRGLTLGLALGNHLTTLLLVPAALLAGSLRKVPSAGVSAASRVAWFRAWQLDGPALRRQLLWFVPGLCFYLILPLRALSLPPVNWGDPVTLKNFWWLVSGGVYSSYYLQGGFAEMGERLQAWAALLVQQFGLLELLLGLLGLIVFGRRTRLYFLTLWSALASSLFALVYGSADSYVYLIPVYLSFALWIGLGFSCLLRQIPSRFALGRLALGLLLITFIVLRASTYWQSVDAAHDERAEAFGSQVLASAPQDAIVFAQGDEAVFSLWYFHFALHQRADLVVIATDLLHFDWYQKTLHAAYPALAIPRPFPWPETLAPANPARPVCHVQYTGQAEIDCSQPVTTP